MEAPDSTVIASEGGPAYTWVATPDAFHEALAAVLQGTRLAIDIEADSLYHYFEKVCLVQISTESATFVIDTLAVKDLGALGPVMADPSIEKVLHAAAYDTYCLRRDYGFTFARLFDTHVAGQLVGYEQLGLSALMERLLGISHSKRRQRDDWSRRPLEAEQLEYAAMDTRHLLQLRDVLERQLEESGRLSWAMEEFAYACTAVPEEREFDPEGFRRIKGCRELDSQKQAVLRALFLMREEAARELDVPPFKVLNNSVLMDLVLRPPQRPRDLFQRSGVSYRVARRWAAEICRTIHRADLEDPAKLSPAPRPPWRPPLPEAVRRLDALKKWRAAKARDLNLHVGVVFPGNMLEVIAATPPADAESLASVGGMRQWRVREFGAEILEILHKA
jgi:ribonuclease D